MPMQDLQITCTHIVCHSQRAIEPLAHVCAWAASFLVPPPSWTVTDAIERGCPRLAIVKIDNCLLGLRCSAFSDGEALAREKAVYVAASAGNLKLVNRMMVKFDVVLLIYSVLTSAFSSFMNTRTLFPSHVIRDAVKSGKLEIVWWICRLGAGDKSIVENPNRTVRVQPDSLLYIIECSYQYL